MTLQNGKATGDYYQLNLGLFHYLYQAIKACRVGIQQFCVARTGSQPVFVYRVVFPMVVLLPMNSDVISNATEPNDFVFAKLVSPIESVVYIWAPNGRQQHHLQELN